MAETKTPLWKSPAQTLEQHSSTGYAHTIAIGLGITVVVVAIGYVLLRGQGLTTRFMTSGSLTTGTTDSSPDQDAKPAKPETLLSREAIDLLLDALDQATRQKDVDGILRHITPDATITIHMKHGSQQQFASLTREEYRKTLAMEFAFPSANDFVRINTTVSLASDKRSAKVSFKSTETLRQARHDLTLEGEQTLVVTIRNDKPIITSLEQIVPGDST